MFLISIMDEVAIAAVLLAICFLIDKATWTFLTGQRAGSGSRETKAN